MGKAGCLVFLVIIAVLIFFTFAYLGMDAGTVKDAIIAF